MVYEGVADAIAARFHQEYERLAPDFGYKTRDASAVPWDEVPDSNRRLMRATVQALLDAAVIEVPFPPTARRRPASVPSGQPEADR